MKRARHLPQISDLPSIAWKNSGGQRERLNKPASYMFNRVFWFLAGERHRDNGPSMIRLNGTAREWCNGGQFLKREVGDLI